MNFDFNGARTCAYDLLTRELMPGLAYHNLSHTRDQVLPAVEIFCRDMDLSSKKRLLISTAALFHDIGFIKQYTDNEKIGAELAASMLPDFGYSEPDIIAVRRLILATRMPQAPKSMAEQIICDADLVSLGQDIFFETSMMLRRELGAFQKPISLRTWFEEQYNFLERHQYFTTAARRRLNAAKEKNRTELHMVLNGHDTSRKMP